MAIHSRCGNPRQPQVIPPRPNSIDIRVYGEYRPRQITQMTAPRRLGDTQNSFATCNRTIGARLARVIVRWRGKWRDGVTERSVRGFKRGNGWCGDNPLDSAGVRPSDCSHQRFRILFDCRRYERPHILRSRNVGAWHEHEQHYRRAGCRSWGVLLGVGARQYRRINGLAIFQRECDRGNREHPSILGHLYLHACEGKHLKKPDSDPFCDCFRLAGDSLGTRYPG